MMEDMSSSSVVRSHAILVGVRGLPQRGTKVNIDGVSHAILLSTSVINRDDLCAS